MQTKQTLERDFLRLGLKPGMTVLVHSSLSSLGWVCGGPTTVIQALQTIVTSEGTLVMPTHSGDLSDPASWQNPPVPESWWPEIRRQMPPFDRQMTPTRGMGKIAELFRTQRGVVRSRHPQLSFAAWGKLNRQITAGTSWNYPLGPLGPLGKIYEGNGKVLLIGVDHLNNTSLHLAEHLLEPPLRHETVETAPWRRTEDVTEWKSFRTIAFDDSDFLHVGRAFEEEHPEFVTRGSLGDASGQLVDQRHLVDFGARWMTTHRHV